MPCLRPKISFALNEGAGGTANSRAIPLSSHARVRTYLTACSRPVFQRVVAEPAGHGEQDAAEGPRLSPTRVSLPRLSHADSSFMGTMTFLWRKGDKMT